MLNDSRKYKNIILRLGLYDSHKSFRFAQIAVFFIGFKGTGCDEELRFRIILMILFEQKILTTHLNLSSEKIL